MPDYFVGLFFYVCYEEWETLAETQDVTTDKKENSMFKMTKLVSVIVLAMMMSLSLCTSGAFAQTVGATNQTTITRVAGLASQEYRSGPQTPGARGHTKRYRCARVLRRVRYGRGWKRVWIRSCRWH